MPAHYTLKAYAERIDSMERLELPQGIDDVQYRLTLADAVLP
jgi:hypothetical protein